MSCWYCECGNPAGFYGEDGNGIALHVESFFGRWVIRAAAMVNGEKATLRVPISHCPFCGRDLEKGASR